MTDFRAGDTVSFTCFGRQYEGVLSCDGSGHLQVKDEDYTHTPDDAKPSGNWLVVYGNGAPAFAISNVRLIHRPAQEGSTMNTTVRLREGDRVTYRRHGNGPITSGPLRPTTVYCTLIERHGLPVVTQKVGAYGQCVIYTSLQDTDGMHFVQFEAEDLGQRRPMTGAIALRLGLPMDHPLTSDATGWSWLTESEMDDAGLDRSGWPTPLRLVDNVTPENDVSATSRIAELEAALEAEREERKREMLDYKAQVKAMARQVGADHDWCVPGQNEVLRDLGIDVTARKRITVGLKFDIVASTEESEPGPTFTEESIRINPERLKDVVSMDSDWSNVEFDHASYYFEVIDIQDEL